MLDSNDWISHKIIWDTSVDVEILIGILSQFEINGIEEHKNSVNVYYQEKALSEEIKTACHLKFAHQLKHDISIDEHKNWNATWEASFDPVAVDDFCIIFADFHQIDKSKYTYNIEITPKMSFGTGHHETTRMMIRQMRQLDFKNKTVFDFGTGTGILAILAEMLGANELYAIDNMEIAVENSIENASNNNCSRIHFEYGTSAKLGQKVYDIVLVNIIRKVILENLDELALLVAQDGFLLLSGYLQHDMQKMRYEVTQRGFNLKEEMFENNWVCQLYQKSDKAS